jgi:acetyl esterase/lipase
MSLNVLPSHGIQRWPVGIGFLAVVFVCSGAEFHSHSWLLCSPASAAASQAQSQPNDEIVYVERDGEPLKFDAYLQSGKGPHPAVVYVHGGGFVTGDKRPCPNHFRGPFFDNGYSVFSVNYRLAPRHPFPAATDDVAAAVKYIKRHATALKVDPKRIVLTGESAGGLISALTGALLQDEDRVAAVIPLFGETDLVLRVSEDPCAMDGHVSPRPAGGCISPGLGAFLGFSEIRNDADRKTIQDASTVTHVRKNMPPYLLIHGTRDFGVPFEQSVSLDAAMKNVGADCTILPIVGGGHGNWTPEQWKMATDTEIKWLNERLPKTTNSTR